MSNIFKDQNGIDEIELEITSDGFLAITSRENECAYIKLSHNVAEKLGSKIIDMACEIEAGK